MSSFLKLKNLLASFFFLNTCVNLKIFIFQHLYKILKVENFTEYF